MLAKRERARDAVVTMNERTCARGPERPRQFLIVMLAAAVFVVVPEAANARFGQQGPTAKLVGSGYVGSSEQGESVAISADGNTAIVGAPGDNSATGAAWIFTRSGGVWTQQGSKLVGTGGVGAGQQGVSVAMSADGNTAIVGGSQDNGQIGAAWVFTRSGGIWTQQGDKLVGTGASGAAQQGAAVALSGDGNTAMVGGPTDEGQIGATWVFTRTGAVWAQSGGKLVGSGVSGNGIAFEGTSVALSGDGNTAIVGGPGNDNYYGSAWVFIRQPGGWTQQGSSLANGVGGQFGGAVSLSNDGNTAIVGAHYENAAWVFTRSDGVWTQQDMLVGDSSVQAGDQSDSVSLSGDGNTAIVGGPSVAGSVWIFARTAGIWTQDHGKLIGSNLIDLPALGWAVALSADGTTAIAGGPYDSYGQIGAAWIFVRTPPTITHDFNDHTSSDIVWRSGGNLSVWLMNSANVWWAQSLGVVANTWTLVGQRDFDGDGVTDFLWRDTSGNTAIWFMNLVQGSPSASLGIIPTNWSVVGTGDFNGDGMTDIAWRDTSGNTSIWLMTGATISSSGGLGNVPTTWSIMQTGDYNGDGKSDLLWRDANGDIAIWFMNGASVASTGAVGNVPTTWLVQSVNSE
jgi:hypothetical protein